MGVFSNKSTAKDKSFLGRLGVSVLFAATAIGVSHVVQSTRAGADFGFALIPVVIACLLLKYPAFLFGPLYTRVTGESLVKGYARLSPKILPVVSLIFLSTMFTVVAAVSLLASGILLTLTGLSFSPLVVGLILVVITTVVNLWGSFQTFHKMMKWVFLFLMVSSVGTLILSIKGASFLSIPLVLDFSSLISKDIFFIAALIGWMPAGLDLPMMHSQWVIAENKKRTIKESIVDFNFGYISTAFLALLFLLIGATFLHGKDLAAAVSAPAFSKALISIYTTNLGEFAGMISGIALFLAIYSSLIMVIDGFPRVLEELINSQKKFKIKRSHCSFIQALGAIVILFFLSSSLRGMIDFATMISFVIAPVFAYLNHKVVFSDFFKQKYQISKFQKSWSLLGIVLFSLFTVFYIYLKFNK